MTMKTVLLLMLVQAASLLTSKNFIYGDNYKYGDIYTVVVNSSTRQIMDFVEGQEPHNEYPSRVHVSTNTTDSQYPLYVTATQDKDAVTWEVFGDAAIAGRTLCPDQPFLQNRSQPRPTLELWSGSPTNVTAIVKLRRVLEFPLVIDREVTVNATPDSPKLLYYRSDGAPQSGTVILTVRSEDDVCAIVSIQAPACPVADSEDTIPQHGYHFTMTTLGAITVTESMFPRGFFVVAVVAGSDHECGAGGSDVARIKQFAVVVSGTISPEQYVAGATVAVAIMAAVAAVVLLLGYCSAPTGPTVEPPALPPDTVSILPAPEPPLSEDDDDDESLCRSTDGPLSVPLTLRILCRRSEPAMSRLAHRYLWTLLTVALVYTLPVVQLLVTYQRMSRNSGEQDLCYYNFLCAHPLGGVSDFNHVTSNVGYVLLGGVFMLQVAWRQRAPRLSERGVPQQYGVLHGMGAALAMEGVLSACYHLCPNSMNFQFDSSFMYVLAVLIMIHLYQSRHPDQAARAHHTFTIIAVIFALCTFGMLYPSAVFWSLLTGLHLSTCFVLTVKMYYVGRLTIDRSTVSSACASLRASPRTALVPRHRTRLVLLAVANVVNWALAIYGLYYQKDVARHILLVLLANSVLHAQLYVGMKVLAGEGVGGVRGAALMVGGAALWGGGIYLFMQSKTKWSEPPAVSRGHNAPCVLVQFYDTHDLWHLTSAAAMFLSLNVLLTVDDGLAATPRDLIPVF